MVCTGIITFASLEDVIFAFEDKRLSLHEWVWVRFNGEVEDEDEMNNPQKKSGLFTFVAGAAAAGAAKNKVSPPIVVPESSDYVVVGMKPVGLNSWQVQFSKRSSLNVKSSFKVQRSRGGSTVGAGGTKFRVSWSG